MSLIVRPYIREHIIDDSATVKNGEAVFTHSRPRSSAPGTDPDSSGDRVRESRGHGHGASAWVAGAHSRPGPKLRDRGTRGPDRR